MDELVLEYAAGATDLTAPLSDVLRRPYVRARHPAVGSPYTLGTFQPGAVPEVGSHLSADLQDRRLKPASDTSENRLKPVVVKGGEPASAGFVAISLRFQPQDAMDMSAMKRTIFYIH